MISEDIQHIDLEIPKDTKGVLKTHDRVDINKLMFRVREKERKETKQNFIILITVISFIGIFGIFLSL
jgi:hypothetical protein